MSRALGHRANDVRDAAAFLKRFGNPDRLAIVARLREGEMTVADLEAELGIRQPSLSQQLAELRQGGIIEARREARSVRYRLVDEKAKALVDLCDLLFGPKPGDKASGQSSPQIGAAVFARVGAGAQVADLPAQHPHPERGRPSA